MIRIAAFFHSRPYIHVIQPKPILDIPFQRYFASHIYPIERTTPLEDSRVVHLSKGEIEGKNPQSHPKFKEFLAELDKLAEKGKKELYGDQDPNQLVLMGPPPDSFEGLLAWRYTNAEITRRNMVPERRKMIEKAALGGDPYFKTLLENIQDYEKRLSEEK